MSMSIDRLLIRYESGQMTRRELLGALTALLVATPAAAASPVPVRALNHVTIFVPNVQRSVEFYQSLFEMPVLTRQGNGVNLKTGSGSGFLGIYPTPPTATAGSINHLCFGVEPFNADETLKALTDRGVKARIRLRDDVKELYLTDPDNISVQLQDPSYIGGIGPLGNRAPGQF